MDTLGPPGPAERLGQRQAGSFTFALPFAGKPLGAFEASWSMLLGDGTGGEGLSFSFGDQPEGTAGEPVLPALGGSLTASHSKRKRSTSCDSDAPLTRFTGLCPY